MAKNRKIFKYFSIIAFKLLLLGLSIVVLNIVLLLAINFRFLHSNLLLPVLVGCIPFVSFLLFYLVNLRQTNFIDKLAYCKYIPFFPYYFHYTKKPARSARIDIDEIKKNIRSCDIVLRRYHNYLDGIIFSENSYFTHVGICYREAEGKPFEVLHSTGELGVHRSTLEDFCNCDNIAILRFSLDKTVEDNKIRHYIESGHPSDEKTLYVNNDELGLYDYLMEKTKTEIEEARFNTTDDFSKHYCKVITDRALSLVGTKYDFNFNFSNFDTFSCIEYVWYCFKCLFPLHRIRVKDFEFFHWIIMPIIIPDVFIKNDFFKFVYASLPDINTKSQLKKFIKKGQKEFWIFILSIFVWNIITLLLFFYIIHPFRG